MHTITLTQKTLKNGHLQVDAYTPYINEEVEVVIVINKKEKPHKHDFSDLTGQLEWNGDALKEQRKLRKEWGKA